MKNITTNQTIMPEQPEKEEAVHPDKSAYLEKIQAMSAEDQAFLDGFLYAKVTSAAKRA